MFQIHIRMAGNIIPNLKGGSAVTRDVFFFFSFDLLLVMSTKMGC